MDSRRARFRSSSACCCVVGAPDPVSVSWPGHSVLEQDGRESWRCIISEPGMIYQYQLCSLSSNLPSYPKVICFALLTVVAKERGGHHSGPKRWHWGRTGRARGPGSLEKKTSQPRGGNRCRLVHNPLGKVEPSRSAMNCPSSHEYLDLNFGRSVLCFHLLLGSLVRGGIYVQYLDSRSIRRRPGVCCC